MGTSGAFIGICITALVEGGPATLASLVVVSSLFQFLLSARLSLLRRIVTPIVAGTVLMLISATVMPILFDMLSDAPKDTATAGAPLTAAVTLVVVIVASLRAPRSLRLWAPLIGVVVGCGVSAAFGMYDFQRVLDAPWIGIPDLGGWPGFNLPTEVFWTLLPRLWSLRWLGQSRRLATAWQFNRFAAASAGGGLPPGSGALNADGVGNLLSGLAGDGSEYDLLVQHSCRENHRDSGKARGSIYRPVLHCAGFFTKGSSSDPGYSERGCRRLYYGADSAHLSSKGSGLSRRDGLDARKAMVVGMSFWVGVGFENKVIFSDLLVGPLGSLLGNGMTAGTICAILLTLFLEFTSSRRRKLAVGLETSSFPRVDEFLREFGTKIGWNEASTDRLRSAGEETLASLLQVSQREDAGDLKLTVSAQLADDVAELEFLVSSEDENLEDRLAILDEQPETPDEREISFRLLQHYASSVHHRQYHDLDVVTVQVSGSR